MPVYVYRRRDGSSFELEQRITVDALVRCPTTGQSVERVMQPFTPHYRGTGFYTTDHHKATPPARRTIQRLAPDAARPRRHFIATGIRDVDPRAIRDCRGRCLRLGLNG